MVTWVANIDGDSTDTLYDVEVEDTFNPFGDFAILKLDDESGTLFDKITRGTQIELFVEPGELSDLTVAASTTQTVATGETEIFNTVQTAGTFETSGTTQSKEKIDRFEGYVVESRELDQAGADALEIEAYTLDQFLRRNQVSNDQSGKALVGALEDIIKTDTPVTWNANLVEVGDPQDVTRSFEGVPVERALRDLSFKSENEEFGVTDDIEFFFRERETEHIDRGVDNTQWINYDIPELGKETINEVEVWYDDGDESVIVDNGDDKLDLQDSLGLPEPGTQRAEINRPALTDISDAEDAGRQYLQFRNNTLTGTVTTYGLFDAEPGDTINITIDPRGIDAEFSIASINYQWGVDETELTIVERKGNDNSEVLFRLTEAVDRIEMQGANRDAPSNRITTTNAAALVDVSATADIVNTNVLSVSSGETKTIQSGETETATTVTNAGTLENAGTVQTQDSGTQSPNATRFVNPGRNAVRDGWAENSTVDIAELVVGSDGSNLSRSNTDLQNQTNSVSVSESLPDSTSVEYSASINQTGVEEIGLKESDGTLVSRAVFDSAIDLGGTQAVTLSISNDTSVSRSVITNDGQTAVRDVVADNSPNLPDAYAYGSDGSSVSESDSALGNQLVKVDLDEILIQEADTNSEWQNIVSIADSDPVEVRNDRLELLQASFTTESDQLSRAGTSLQQDTVFSNDEAERIDESGDTLELSFTVEYTIPEADVGAWVRITTAGGGTGPELTLTLNGDTWIPVGSNTGFSGGLQWRDLANDPAGTSETYSGGDLTPGSYTLRIEGTSSGDGQDIDVVSPLDNRFSWTFDNDTTSSGERVDGPELYPEQYVQGLDTASTRRDTTGARFTSTWNDISNNQYIEVANDGSTFTRFNNTDSATATFNSGERGVDTNIALSRYGSRTSATPQTGFNGQYISTWELYATIIAIQTDGIGETIARAIVQPNTINGSTVREAGLFSGSTMLTSHELAEFDVLQDQRLASAETTAFKND